MINFFRAIRQKSITEHRFIRYLLYAIGEIFLVVVGILIALQANAWKEERKNAQKESLYIQSLQNELELQIEAIEMQLESEELYISSAVHVINKLKETKETEAAFDEEFFDHLTSLTVRTTFRIVDATYTDLISTGDLNLISSDEMKNDIVAYFQELERIESIIQNNNSELVDNVFNTKALTLTSFYETGINFNQKIENDAIELLKVYDPEEALFATKRILEPENKLVLNNIVKLRLSLASFHAARMEELKVETEALAKRLERSTNP